MSWASTATSSGWSEAGVGNRFGPSRGEIWLRFAISLAGLGLMAVALATRRIGGIASLEVMLIAGAFFGGSALWCAWTLWRGRGED